MNEQHNSQPPIESSHIDAPMVEHEGETNIPLGNTLAIQNNNYFIQQVDLVALGKLTTKNPEIARMYMDIQKEQLEHGKDMDKEIVSLERVEQQAEEENRAFLWLFCGYVFKYSP